MGTYEGTVVSCLKISIFALVETILKIILLKVVSCELLKN